MYFLHPSPAGCIPAAAGGEGIGTASASPLPDSPLLSFDRWTLPHVHEPLKALGGWSNNVWARRPLPAAHTQKHTHTQKHSGFTVPFKITINYPDEASACGPTWLRLVSLRLRQKDELLDRGRVSVPFALFLWSLRAWALISTARRRGGARDRTRREREGQEGGQVENNKKEQCGERGRIWGHRRKER